MCEEKFDLIIVGGGLAGITAALKAAREGLQVVLLERGEYPGSKNVMGGILFTQILNKLIPEFWDKGAPVERHVTKRTFSLLTEKAELAVSLNFRDFNEAPFNNSFTCLRSKFDRWYAEQAEEAGAEIYSDMVVDSLITKDGKVIGVNTRGEDGELYADCVILADGANSLLAKSEGLHKEFRGRDMVVCCKEVISLPQEVIEDRFHLEGNEGASLEFFSDAVAGVVGSGFIYTNKDTLSVGLGLPVDISADNKLKPYELLDRFKNHPCVRPLIRGGKVLEYAAHMIPEMGFDGVPPLYKNGLMVTGDAAGLVNTSIFHEGSCLAMASGLMAAETAIEAKKKGDYSSETLKLYDEKMRASFVIKDLKRFRRIPEFLHGSPQFFGEYPKTILSLIQKYFAVSETPKAETEKELFASFREEIGILNGIKEGYKLWRTFG
jgi:electron transfer flavoprotein-quinone oxidoreductase